MAQRRATNVASSWRLRWPAEWLVAAALAVGTLVVIARGHVLVLALDRQLYGQLASAFTAGPIAALAAAFGARLIGALPRSHRRWWCRGGLFAAVAVAGFLLRRWHPAGSWPVARLLGVGALALLITSGALALFLWVSGLVRAHTVARAGVDLLRLWGPFAVFMLCSGFCLSATRPATPRVIDPLLLRMDASLGFSPSVTVFCWAVGSRAVEWLSTWGYPLLGLMIATIVVRLDLAGARAQARRALVAVVLVGTLGLLCYRLLPAVGPLYAFPQLFAHSAGSNLRTLIAPELAQALRGPARLPVSATLVRNAMPSLHVAFTLVTLAAAWNWRRRFFWSVVPLGVVQIASTLTLCLHYLVDLVAAVPFAAVCWWLADFIVRVTGSGTDVLPPVTTHKTRRSQAWLLASLIGGAGGLWVWAAFAPLPSVLTWPLAISIVVFPAWAVMRNVVTTRPADAVVEAGAARMDWRVRVLRAGVVCSGGIAVVLEQIYEKYLSTVVGSSRASTTIVLAVYFAGLAGGAWLCPKRRAGAPRRLAAYEWFVAGWAALVSLAFFASDRLIGGWLAAAGGSTALLLAVRVGVAALWILPPTLAMGAQLPTLAAVLSGHPRWQHERLTHYYAINLWGAFAFTLAAPPLLFNFFGADGTLRILAVLGGGVGFALWLVLPPVTATGAPLPQATVASRAAWPASRRSLGLALGSGFLFFALEVVWFHLIAAVCGASTYSFSWLLAIVLLGLAFAGRAVHRQRRGHWNSVAAILSALLPILALSNAAWPWAGRVMLHVQQLFAFDWFWAGELLKCVVVGALVLPPAVLLGRVFPLVLRKSEDGAQSSRATGWLCAINVLGCVGGALFTGFLLIPTLGAERTLLGLSLATGAAGAVAVVSGASGRRHWLLIGGGLGLLVLLPRWNRLELTRGFGVYLGAQGSPARQLAFWREDFESGFVSVTTEPSPVRVAPVKTLWQNGKFDADDGDEMPAQIGFGLVAGVHAPAGNRALVIGCGSGQTASVIARLGFRQVDIVEMSPAHLAAARAEFSAINAHVLDRSNVRVHVEDGRNFLLRSRERYDAIQVELTSVWFAGATNLYSREFYALARAHLTPDGVLAQWVQLHHLTPRELASILATARAEFPIVSVWRAGHQACLLASASPPRLNPALWRQWRSSPEFFDDVLITGLLTPESFAAQELVSPAQLDALLARTTPVLNTDRNRWLEYQSPKYDLERSDLQAENLVWLTRSTVASP